MRKLVRLWRNASGASAAEYGLILAIVGTGLALAAIFLGGVVSSAINEAATCIQSDGGNC